MRINCLINSLRLTGKNTFSSIEIERIAHECERSFLKDEMIAKEQQLKDIEYHLQKLREDEKISNIGAFYKTFLG